MSSTWRLLLHGDFTIPARRCTDLRNSESRLTGFRIRSASFRIRSAILRIHPPASEYGRPSSGYGPQSSGYVRRLPNTIGNPPDTVRNPPATSAGFRIRSAIFRSLRLRPPASEYGRPSSGYGPQSSGYGRQSSGYGHGFRIRFASLRIRSRLPNTYPQKYIPKFHSRAVACTTHYRVPRKTPMKKDFQGWLIYCYVRSAPAHVGQLSFSMHEVFNLHSPVTLTRLVRLACRKLRFEALTDLNLLASK
jgi:hypothetical protein